MRVQVVVPSAIPRPHAMLAGGAKLQWDAGLAELRRRQHIHAICYQLRSVVSGGGGRLQFGCGRRRGLAGSSMIIVTSPHSLQSGAAPRQAVPPPRVPLPRTPWP